MIPPRPLPEQIQRLCNVLNAPPRLVAHLRLVHDTAVDLVAGLDNCFPTLDYDDDSVLFGASTHDLGKVLHPKELTTTGNQHEQDGPALLEQYGIPPCLSRFARTHGIRRCEEDQPLEDLLVALADAIWKGRCPELEGRVVQRIAAMISLEQWQVFLKVDDLANRLSADEQERLAWQQRF
jgi:hypothetical protein